MAQFYGSIQGSAGEATRLGHKNSGITGHIRGWNVGARVDVTHEDGRDVVRVFKTGGSHDPYGTLIAEFTDE